MNEADAPVSTRALQRNPFSVPSSVMTSWGCVSSLPSLAHNLTEVVWARLVPAVLSTVCILRNGTQSRAPLFGREGTFGESDAPSERAVSGNNAVTTPITGAGLIVTVVGTVAPPVG